MSEPLTESDVRAMLERAEKASPPPWIGWINTGDCASSPPSHGGIANLPRVPVERSEMFRPDDAAFISCAREDLPALALSWLEQRQELEALKRDLRLAADRIAAQSALLTKKAEALR